MTNSLFGVARLLQNPVVTMRRYENYQNSAKLKTSLLTTTSTKTCVKSFPAANESHVVWPTLATATACFGFARASVVKRKIKEFFKNESSKSGRLCS